MKKQFRIHKNEEFQKILKQRRFTKAPSMVIYYQPKQERYARVGITVSKKIGKAVIRNKIKRQIRMMCQEVLNFEEAYDMIIMVRSKYLEFTFEENKETLQKLVNKLNNEFNTGDINV